MSGDEFDDLYGSKYLSVADLKGGQPQLRIGKVEIAELREKNGGMRRKLVAYFDGQEKALVLNKTNATTLANAFGKQYANWVGQHVQLFTAPTSYGDGVRVRPLRKPASVAEPDPDLNDAIPFA
jgi:hypothetical protein